MCFEVANCFQALDLREGEGLRGGLNAGGGRGGGCWGRVAEMRIAKAKVQRVQRCRPRAFHYGAEAEREEPFPVAPRLSFGDKHLKKGWWKGGEEKRGGVGGALRIWMR